MEVSRYSLMEWQEELNALGPRLTATVSHSNYIEYLKSEIKKMGYAIDSYPFKIDVCEQGNAHVSEKISKKEIHNLGAVPYSGITKSEGISGSLKWFKNKNDSEMKGKIAIIRVKNFSIPRFLLLKIINKRPKNGKSQMLMRNPVVTSSLVINKIKQAKQSGAVGAILIWDKISEELATKQVLPFTNEYLDIPAVWIHRKEQGQLERIIANSSEVNMYIPGTIKKNSPTESFTVTIEGEALNKVILINTHTDGPNAIEDNGPVALLSFLQAIKEHKISFKHTIVFAFVSGHFQIPQAGFNDRQATSRLLDEIDSMYLKKQIQYEKTLGITIEHLGVMEYIDNPQNNCLINEGKFEPMYVYTSKKNSEDLLSTCLEDMNPMGKYFLLKPKKGLFFGEGQPLFQSGWPVMSFIAMPQVLCQLPSYRTEPDLNLMYDQVNFVLYVLFKADQKLL